MTLELTDREATAFLALLNRTIENDRYPLSPRIRVMRGIRVKAAGRSAGAAAGPTAENRPAAPWITGIELIGALARLARRMNGASPYRLLATVLNVAVRLVPTDVIITMAATAISAAIRPYSIAVTPRSFSTRCRRIVKVRIFRA